MVQFCDVLYCLSTEVNNNGRGMGLGVGCVSVDPDAAICTRKTVRVA